MDLVSVRHRKDEGRSYKGIPIHAAPGVHEAAAEILGRHVLPPATVLDLGGGSGAFAARLCDMGYRAELADLDPPPSISLPSYKVDLNKPFDVSSFGGRRYDSIVATEVIEHLENLQEFLRQVRDLLCDNGVFFITTPNVLDLDSRRRMLTRGEFWLFRRGTLFSTGHLNILPYWLLQEILEKEGWTVRERRFIGCKKRRGWRKFMVPLVNLAFVPFGLGIPLEAAFAPCVAFACSPRKASKE
jgi:SAM-dependent methyltransferase